MHSFAEHLFQSHLFQYIFLAGAALLGGLVNAVAGGGGFIGFPSLLKVGLLPIEANATSTVALWPGQFTSIAGYREDLKRNRRLVIPVMLVAFAGGLAGAITLLKGTQHSFMRIVPYLFLMGAASFAFSGPVGRLVRRRMAESEAHPEQHRRVLLVPLLVALLAISYYIGYFGAGSGLLTMTALALCGVERIAEINALKTVITTTANAVACVTFIIGGAVEWRYCWLMMITCAIGGYTGARNARRISDRVMRPIIIVIGFTIAIYFFLHRQSL
ncbi:MAG TPA: sulfite exporter TauE/SafE family protein [Acidobacteriaceae bacterium]|nr:sulfite exporter TauE/SafE family protein [Acidobacteriaceae bacterium]